ncbi:MAG: hypothetical protein IFNCLDLE_02629 [Ignavibacteriaceae bacterium]|nr:hypothetical protein [Ignavibacteriaceae bacterium]
MEIKRRVRKDNHARDLKIIKDYNAGRPIAEIMSENVLSRGRIYQILKKYEG